MSSADAKDISATAPEEENAADEAVADDADDAAEPSSGAERRASRQAKKAAATDVSLTISVRRIKQVVGGLVVVGVLAVIAVGGWQLYQKDQRLAAFDDSKSAASAFVVTYFEAMGGPNATAESLRKAVGPLSTGAFKTRLQSDAVVSTEFMKENKVDNVKTTVTSSMVESFDADSATVVLGVDVSGTSAISAGGGKNALLLQLSMEKVDGDWLVSSIEAGPGVTVGAQQGTPAPGQAPAENTPADNTPAAPAPAPGG